ncbi:MAG TPA: DUF305 domain-containing protein [Thermoanaerobaculia bacterium]|nr:DUF305 domain-containing protein [Thermoanaerobaculia bacterium]
MSEHAQQATAGGMKGGYRRLLVMIVLSFIAMYVLMYAMVDRFANVYANLNQFYMAGLMTGAMVIIELSVMSGMYHNKKLNKLLLAASIVALAACWFFIRRQTAISDRQFLESMIPHHAGAILMCQQAPINDAEIHSLCQEIVLGQQKEIDQMKGKLQELDR